MVRNRGLAMTSSHAAAALLLALSTSGCAQFLEQEEDVLRAAEQSADRLTLRAIRWLCKDGTHGSHQRLPDEQKTAVLSLCRAFWRQYTPGPGQ